MSGTTYFLVGPTASGKTQVGLIVAEAMGAEIISLDSMAVYRGMDIGTAKPTVEDRMRVPFHLVDVRDPTDGFSAGDYVKLACEAVEGMRARGARPLFVGGTPMYLRLLTQGLFRGPRADWDFRKHLRARAKEEGTVALHRELARVDPDAARRIHSNDLRRIERALEVYHVTGRPMSELQRETAPALAGQTRIVGLRRHRDDLYRRIDERVERMWEAGLVEEVRQLDRERMSRSASQALGYREVRQHLAGELTSDEARELIKLRTRQFAKRQMTWFRSVPDLRWVDVAPDDSAEAVARRTVALM
jgi:tRNA dimethylallyltransferase